MLYEEALEIETKVLPSSHPSLAVSKFLYFHTVF